MTIEKCQNYLKFSLIERERAVWMFQPGDSQLSVVASTSSQILYEGKIIFVFAESYSEG